VTFEEFSPTHDFFDYRRPVACTTATNDRLSERARTYRCALPLLGALKSMSELCSLSTLASAKFRSADSSRAANFLTFVVRLRE
jgi:hypothetical protein